MVERGVGEYQIRKAEKSRTLIVNALANGKWEQYNKVVRKTGLSTATVSKYLKKLEEEREIEKKIDIKSGKYPYPVHYRLTKKGFETRNKDTIKKRIDETPLEYSSLDITRRSLEAKVDVPGWYKKFDKLLAKFRLKEVDKREYDWPTTYSVMSDSKLVKEWKDELYNPIKSWLNERHPKLEGEFLEFFTQFLMTSLFANLEKTAHLNILSSLKLPPMGISKYKPISAKFDLGLDAEVYSRLLETVVLLLKTKYDQKEELKDFLEETRGTSMILTIDLNTDFHSILEYFDKKFFETEQLRAKGYESNNSS